MKWLEEIFCRPAGNIEDRPTNSEFIARMAEYISIRLSVADNRNMVIEDVRELERMKQNEIF